jgi:DNA-binding Lrp family transcriptional regulator
MECHLTTGYSDYLIRVAVADIGALEKFILNQLTPIPGIEKIRSRSRSGTRRRCRCRETRRSCVKAAIARQAYLYQNGLDGAAGGIEPTSDRRA